MPEVIAASSTYPREDFVSLVGPIDRALFLTHISDLVLDVPIINIAVTSQALTVTWADFPSAADRIAIAGRVATFVGGATTKEPITVESFAALPTTSGTPVLKAQIQTLPLDGGTYTFNWNSQIRMNPAGAASGVQGLMRITRSDGVVREQPDAWDLTAPHAFNGAIIFSVIAGQTLHAEALVSRLGAAGTAEMLGVRLTIDQRAPEGA